MTEEEKIRPEIKERKKIKTPISLEEYKKITSNGINSYEYNYIIPLFNKELLIDRTKYAYQQENYYENSEYVISTTPETVLLKDYFPELIKRYEKNKTNFQISEEKKEPSNSTFLSKITNEHDADVNAKDKYGVPPLHWATLNNNPDLCEYLIENGADTSLLDKESKSKLEEMLPEVFEKQVTKTSSFAEDLNKAFSTPEPEKAEKKQYKGIER